MADPPSDAGALARIARHHGVSEEEIRPAAGGEGNHVFLLGDELVLRIARQTPESVANPAQGGGRSA